MGESCVNIGEGGGEKDETPRYMKIPMQDMMFGDVFVNPKYEAWKRRRLIKALQRPPRGIDARLAAKGVPPDSGFQTLVEELGLTMEAVAPYMSAFKPNTTGTDLMLPRIKIIHPKVILRGGAKRPAADPSEPTGIQTEGMHNYPLKSKLSNESLVVDTNPVPEPEAAAATAAFSGTKAEVQGGSLLKRPCDDLGNETLQENKRQKVPKGNCKEDL